jgi:hypothetical protein
MGKRPHRWLGRKERAMESAAKHCSDADIATRMRTAAARLREMQADLRRERQ